ncbi:MAG: SDR family oxidoreductase [Actinobacteria bacterium]|nr:SDR family oxidoreductase [Actinomycetota bacterium]
MAQLEGKTALVTGAARGIGRATAAALVDAGATVLISDVDGDEVERTAAELGTYCYVGDLTVAGVSEDAVERAVSISGTLDVIVNNAGYTLDAPLHKLDIAHLQRMLDIHLLVPFRILSAAARYLREPAKEEARAGREVFRKVVNVSSVSGTMGNAGQTNYAAAKAGIVGLTKALAKEWGPLKINVNAVAFGMIDTRLTAPKAEVSIAGELVGLGIPEANREAFTQAIPFGRAGTAEEAASVIEFLCSPASDYVTGQVVNVAGGLGFGMTA